jgi:hypothetical protein
MKNPIRAVLAACVMVILSLAARAVESTWNYAVQVTASVQSAPAKITLSWTQDTTATPSGYTVYRKAPGATSWGTGTSLPGSATSYEDTSVSVGTAYEYQVVRNAGGYSAYGYALSGIDVPLVENRGKVVLVVDNTHASALAAELTRLQEDLAGDGWTVVRHDVARNDSPAAVKALIRSAYNADPANVKSVFLFGHVPVPYSGQLNPDGHPDHLGAWPADAYYGDMDGNWTDASVNYTQTINTDPADAARLTNRPGDGKFDHNTLPSAIELQVGRVDLANMPGLTGWNSPATFKSELELLRQYLKKDHDYRHRLTSVQRRAIIGDYFGVRNGEAFAASAYRAAAPIVGNDKITNLNVQYNDQRGVFVSSLKAGDYLFAYGCGAGSYKTIGGLGNVGQYNDTDTVELVSNDIHGVFTFLFGSWLGDWDHEDSILRSVLATQTNGLASAWSGRPHWFLHKMALGETIGSTAQLAQNNPNGGLYRNQQNNAANSIHIALMGDPTLRLYPVAPPASLGGTVAGTSVALTWAASPDTVVGYNVYRATSANGPFTRLNSSLLNVTAYTDLNAPTGAVYMVRAVKRETSPSGTYFNASQGLFWKVGGSAGPVVSGDTTAPTVAMSAPAAGSTVSGTANVTANASDNVGVVGVQFLLDGNPVGAEDTAAPYSLAWDSAAAANGPHTLAAIARDLAGNRTTSSALTINVSNTSGSTGGTPSASTAWVDDALPAGASGTGSNGDGWNWVSSSPTPFSGTKAHQSNAATGLHEHAFSWASSTMPVAVGDKLFAYIYLDPANPPTEILISWLADNWEHRAYWGANQVPYGTNGTNSLRYVGPLPATGQWVRLEVPASQVGLEGQTVTGMSFGLYGGKATWDYAGRASATATAPTSPTGPSTVTVTATDATAVIGSNDTAALTFTRTGGSTSAALTVKYALSGTAVKWLDYRRPEGDMPVEVTIPAGATSATMTIAGIANVTNANPETAIVTLANDSAYTVGNEKSATITIAPAGTTPTAPAPAPAPTPTADTTVPKVAMSAPKLGATVSGKTVTVTAAATDNVGVAGVQFLLDGKNLGAEDTIAPYTYVWDSTTTTNGLHTLAAIARDAAGNTAKSLAGSVTVNNPVTTTPTPSTGSLVTWIDDALPKGASGSGTGGDGWNWVTKDPAPFSGNKAHQSNLASGLHEHSFNWASPTMDVVTGDTLVAHIYLDPANPPSAVMISWLADNWEHRAYWGANVINYGTNNTASRRYMGALPAAGQWVRLEVPASQVGLEGQSVRGMSFSLQGGRATWDAIGRAPAGSSGSTGGTTGPATVTLAATDTTAAIASSDNGAFTFTRTGSTTAPLTVKFALSGTAIKWIDYRRPEGDMPVEVTIPAGATSTVMNIVAFANVTASNPATAVATLSPDAAYTVGTQKSGAITILPTSLAGTTPTDSTGSTGGTSDGSTGGSTGSTGGSTGTPATGTVDPTGAPAISVVDYTKLAIPSVGSSTLHVLSPTTVELVRINTAATGGAVDSWNFVNSSGVFTAPSSSQIAVTVNGQTVPVQTVGFKRRPLYAPLISRDLRIANSLVLQLASPIAEGQTVEVKNPDAALWPSTMEFKGVAHPLRYSPAIHVNQEGYMPGMPKRASVGYYLGNLGEMVVPNLTYSIVDAATGTVAYSGTLTVRPDSGWAYSPTPYQKVYEADFTSFATPGEYKLVVPGLGASLPLMVDDGIAMAFTRTYAQGLYHQRCGHANELPFTRHTHATCHVAPATVPTEATAFTWQIVAQESAVINSNNPAQTAPRLTSPSTQLYPFVKTGELDVSGGHHDAGDYSKYTINSAALVHTLAFSVDSIAGTAALDNLGLPESGDGISDLMQEAKIESDFLAKLQDSDGGFYFLVYPKDRRYESNVLPDRSDPQVVWPKNTAATAAAVAALAEMASSPRFKAAYPQAAADYLAKAKLGWKFLTDAIAKHGKAGAYQKITHYGDDFTHDDELAWAAAAMFAATGDAAIHNTLKTWFNPSDPATYRWGWWHGFMSYGNAVRSYAFAARSGRLPAASLDATYLAKCEAEVRAAGNDALKWTQDSAYGTAFPTETKRMQSAGWYFSAAQAFDIAVARQLDSRADYVDAILRNMNYEGGSNALNLSYVTGLGWKRQKEIVHQYAQNDDRLLPPNGIPQGNLQTGPVYTPTYGTELASLMYPRDNGQGSSLHGFYDRWSDTFNVTTEFVHLDQARGLAAIAYLATLTPTKSQAWKSATATITGVPATPALGTPITVGLQVPGMNLDGARIIWEAKGTTPAFGETYTFTPGGYGAQWVEVEAQWPDGRRAVGRVNLFAENGLPTVTVAATDAIATIANPADTAVYTFTRAGSTKDAITVNFRLTGTAAKWTDYRRPEGDMPESIVIPAGAASATLTIRAHANTTNANPATVVLTLQDGSGYNVGTTYNATITLK